MIEIRIPSGDWSLAATLSGEHPRLVFLHPGVADRRCWFDVMPALVPDFPAVAGRPDRPECPACGHTDGVRTLLTVV